MTDIEKCAACWVKENPADEDPGVCGEITFISVAAEFIKATKSGTIKLALCPMHDAHLKEAVRAHDEAPNQG